MSSNKLNCGADASLKAEDEVMPDLVDEGLRLKNHKLEEQEEEDQLCDDVEDECDEGKSSLNTQVCLTVACCVVHLSVGCILGFSGVTLPQLINTDLNEGNNSSANHNMGYLENINISAVNNVTSLRYFITHNIESSRLNLSVCYKCINNHEQNVSISLASFQDLILNKTENTGLDILKLILENMHIFVPCMLKCNDVGYSNLSVSNNNTVPTENSFFSHLTLNEKEATLFSSGSSLGAVVGSSLSGIIMVIFGQRTVLLFFLPFTTIAWIVLASSTLPAVLIGSRIATGISMGLLSATSTLFVLEVAHNKYRGYLNSAGDLARNSGILFMFLIGLSKAWWRYQALLVGILTTVPPFIIMWFLKPSPRWLMTKNKTKQAEKALEFYRGSQYNIHSEMKGIKKAASMQDNKKIGLLEQTKFMFTPKVFKLMLRLALIATGSHFTGNFALVSYASTILIESIPSIDPFIAAVILGVLRSGGGLLFFSTSGKFGRRYVYLASMLTCSTSMCILGTFNYLVGSDTNTTFWWIPMAALMVFFSAVTIAAPSGGLIIHELVPLKCRLLACSTVDLMFFAAGFAISQSFTSLRNSIHLYGTFWFYSCCSAIMAFMPLLLVPETLNKRLEDIEVELGI